MRNQFIPIYGGVLLTLVSCAASQLPYNPTQLLSTNTSHVYRISADTGLTFSALDVSHEVGPSSQSVALQIPISFQEGQTAVVAASDGETIMVLAGNCQDEDNATQLWKFKPAGGSGNGTWTRSNIDTSSGSLNLNYLTAGFSYPPTTSSGDASLLVFGGMCPIGTSNASTWTSQADYSNNMITLSDNTDVYQFSAKRSSPVVEAGLTVTPLQPLYSNLAAARISSNQNFVLIGGHTQTAFINMSQVAVYSLPTAGWSFVDVSQPNNVQNALERRATDTVEPRSGHTALLSEDGSQIIIFGGWVGKVTNAATPQLAVLQLSDNSDGSTAWSWSVPTTTGSPLPQSSGLYGHGAVLLPGNVMMVSGGISIGQSTSKRAISNYSFYNITSSTWSTSYTNPRSSSNAQPNTSRSSEGVGLGVGLGIGLAVIIVAIAAWFLWRHHQKQKRVEGERRLRAMALGSERFQSGSQVFPTARQSMSEVRSTSWGSAQEKNIEGVGVAHPWPPSSSQSNQAGMQEFDFGLDSEGRQVERTGLDMTQPSPTRGLRRSLHSKGPAGYGVHFGATVPAGSVFRIDEEEEMKHDRSSQTASRLSDPFKDPPRLDVTAVAAANRRREVQSWVEDWQSAAESMTLSRNHSHARTYSNLSQAYSSSHSTSDRGRLSPEKSDRTNSNLSERSAFSAHSAQRSIGASITRTMSQRSVSAGYAMFAGAAAAMSKLASGPKDGQLDRSASKRSVSLNTSQARQGRPLSVQSHHGLLRDHSPVKSEYDVFRTPPESPIRDYKNYSRTSSLTSQGVVKAKGVIGSMKRVFTGTSQVDVEEKVEHYEEVEKEAQDTPSQEPEAIEVVSYPPVVPFWQAKKGARDWEHDDQHLAPEPSTIRRRSGGRTHGEIDANEYEGEDWDVETAIQKRVVQVMFTMPKERLRVVNADALSLISRSDTGDREDEGRNSSEPKRMSSLQEGDEVTNAGEKDDSKGKGRAPTT